MHAGKLQWGSAVASSAAERAARAGWGLSAASIHWGKRGAAAKPVAVTERDRRLLELLHDVNYLSSSQMALLGWGADSTCTRRRLRLLHDRGLIDKFRPAAPAGSYEWNYRLTGEGWRMLSDRGMAAERKLYKPAEIHSIAYVEHDLQVNALVLDIAHRARAREGPLLDAMPFTWHGPRSGEIDPREEQAPEGESQLRSRLPRFFHGGSREGVIKPDATLILGGAEPRQAVLLEYDRTARPHKQLDRLRRYDWFLTEGWTRGRFAHHPVAPALVLVTLHESALNALVKAADETLECLPWIARHRSPASGCTSAVNASSSRRASASSPATSACCARPRTPWNSENSERSIDVRPSSRARSSSTSSRCRPRQSAAPTP